MAGKSRTTQGYRSAFRKGSALFIAPFFLVNCDGGVGSGVEGGSAALPSTNASPIAPSAPSAPSGLRAVGSLNHIVLNWTASTGSGLSAYRIYRSADGGAYTQIATVAAPAVTYDDSITSTGDGVLYSYKVTAYGNAESAFSAVVRSAHGIRLTSSGVGLTTVGTGPQVVEGSITVNGGNFTVSAGSRVYVLDGARIDVEQGYGLTISGLIRVLASTTNPATFTSHHVGGTLGNTEGIRIRFNGCIDYNPSDHSGTLLQNSTIENLAGFGNSIVFFGCSPKLTNLKLSSNASDGSSYIDAQAAAHPIISRNSFAGVSFTFQTDLRGTTFSLDHNIILGGYYSISFYNLNHEAVSNGQITGNILDGRKQAYLYNMTGTNSVPIGGNYWAGSLTPPLPPVLRGLTPGSYNFDFTPALTTRPTSGIGITSEVGPTW